jgi:hypothetical protein
MLMIAILAFTLAATVGVVLAAVDGPYPHDRKLIERICVLLLTVGAAIMVVIGTFTVRGSLLD